MQLCRERKRAALTDLELGHESPQMSERTDLDLSSPPLGEPRDCPDGRVLATKEAVPGQSARGKENLVENKGLDMHPSPVFEPRGPSSD